MTSKAALAQALIKGHVINIKNAFHLFGITNAPREVSRSIEKAFGVTITRTLREGKSRYGQPCVWMDYSLEPTEANAQGITKMINYIHDQKKLPTPKTEKQAKEQKQIKQAIGYVDNLIQKQLF